MPKTLQGKKIAWTKIPPELQMVRCDKCKKMVYSINEVAIVFDGEIACHRCFNIKQIYETQ